MRQTTYELADDSNLDDITSLIKRDCAMHDSSSRLLLMVEPTDDVERIERHLSAIRKHCPQLPVAGVSRHWVSLFDTPQYSSTAFSLLEFDSSQAQVFAYPYAEYSFDQAADDFISHIRGCSDFKAALVFTANAFRPCNAFLEKVSAAFPEVTFSGMQAGSPQTVVDRYLVFTDEGVSHDMLVIVAFCGKDLRAHDCYSLGWRPLGREHQITEVCKGGIKTIDGRPAAELYERYLEIDPGDDFGGLALPFPLITYSNDLPVAHVAIRTGDEGELFFSSDFQEDDYVSLSYSKVDYLLQRSLDLANGLRTFAPQAVVMSPCLNRRAFLGDAAEGREIAYFQRLCPELVFASGFGELYMKGTSGGILNSTLVVLALREGEPTVEEIQPELVDEQLRADSRLKTRAERLVTFLEMTTKELRSSNARLGELSRIDELTGIPNRRSIMSSLSAMLENLAHSKSLTLIMYDIDGFKQVNDCCSHTEGDRVLREVSSCVSKAIRSDDIQGRWGGDEFLIIARGMNPEMSLEMGERIRRAVENADFSGVEKKTHGKVTISVGVTCGTSEDDADTLFCRADKALYRSKESGRNRVTLL